MPPEGTTSATSTTTSEGASRVSLAGLLSSLSWRSPVYRGVGDDRERHARYDLRLTRHKQERVQVAQA
jgi:hypothetical protein